MDYGTNNNTLANLTTQSTRAFTGHEQISEISGLIHSERLINDKSLPFLVSNARVYDSDIGRFLSADTIIQDPHDSQSYNRYSYVRNNPLKYTDPTGNSWWTKFRDKWVKPIVAVVVGAIIAIYAPALLGAYIKSAFGVAVATGALAGAAGGAIMTGTLEGTLKGAVFGALSAGVAYGIGHGGGLFAKVRQYGGAVGKAALHGISRAAISKLQTGSGKGGFLGGFASSLLGGVVNSVQTASTTVKVTMAVIAGGTASVLGGGKFSNGAMSGAFIMMFNELANTYPSRDKLRQVDPKQLRAMRVLAVMERSRNFPLRGMHPLSYSQANDVVSAMERLNGKMGDIAGLGLSIGSAFNPAGIGVKMAVAAITIDVLQGDPYGIGIGAGALFLKPFVPLDLAYGGCRVSSSCSQSLDNYLK